MDTTTQRFMTAKFTLRLARRVKRAAEEAEALAAMAMCDAEKRYDAAHGQEKLTRQAEYDAACTACMTASRAAKDAGMLYYLVSDEIRRVWINARMARGNEVGS